jgi:hypothetical protein
VEEATAEETPAEAESAPMAEEPTETLAELTDQATAEVEPEARAEEAVVIAEQGEEE